MHKKSIKLILYIGSLVFLGVMTIFEIVSIRDAQIKDEVIKQEDAISELREVVGLWEEREPFVFKGELFVSTSSAEPSVSVTENQ